VGGRWSRVLGACPFVGAGRTAAVQGHLVLTHGPRRANSLRDKSAKPVSASSYGCLPTVYLDRRRGRASAWGEAPATRAFVAVVAPGPLTSGDWRESYGAYITDPESTGLMKAATKRRPDRRKPVPSDLLDTREVATIFSVSQRTIANWAVSGKLAGWRTPGGQLRFARSEVLAAAKSGRSPKRCPHCGRVIA
jgi:excisionase family DNA binding protein